MSPRSAEALKIFRLMIWPGVLRGEESFGMICSAKELRLPNAPAKKGILELPFDAEGLRCLI